MDLSLSSSRRVGIFVADSVSHLRQVQVGLRRYALNRRWQIMRHSMALSYIPQALQWGAQGFVAHVASRNWVSPLAATGLPVINTSQHLDSVPFMTVVNDNHATGRIAADHLLSKGFRHFAWAGVESIAFSRLRLAGFRERLQEAGCPVESQFLQDRIDPVQGWPANDKAMDEALDAWVRSLPRATAIFATSDQMGARVIAACIACDRAVPEDIAVLGVDDDQLECEFAFVSLSSVRPDSERTGWLVAQTLDRLMADPDALPPGHVITLPPLGVTQRRSTDIVSIEDPDLAAALRIIRERACEPINVQDVLDQLPISRRSLEQRFRKVLGRSPLEEIHRLRIEAVHLLLRTTDLPMYQIAARCGYRDANFLSRVFRKETGKTLRDFRRQHRSSLGPA